MTARSLIIFFIHVHHKVVKLSNEIFSQLEIIYAPHIFQNVHALYPLRPLVAMNVVKTCKDLHK